MTQSKPLNVYQSEALDAHIGQEPGVLPYYGSQWGDPQAERYSGVRAMLDDAHTIGRGSRLLEIGPGGGRWTKYIARKYRKTLLTLVDNTDNSIKLVQQYLGVVYMNQVVHFDTCPDGILPADFYGGDFDTVFSFDVFVHFGPDLFFRYLNSVAKALKFDGCFIFNFGCAFPGSSNWKDGTGCFHYYEPESVYAWLRAVGLQPVGNHDLPGGYGSRTLLCQKSRPLYFARQFK